MPITFVIEEVTFSSSGKGIFALLCANPSVGSLNEHEYQTVATVDKLAFKIDDRFGEYLGLWRAWMGVVMKRCPGACVTSHYDRQENVLLWEEAMGVQSTLTVRAGSMGLGDSDMEHKFLAMSPTLAPKALQLGPKLLPVDGVLKQGVIAEPADIFPPTALPECVAAFMDQKPTIAVTLSSFGQVQKVIDFFPLSSIYQVLFIGSNCVGDADESHMHNEGPLDLNLVFAKATFVVHGCGTGTVYQVALSGKPSIGISSMIEQEHNGKALEDLCISKHFALKALWYDSDGVVTAFRSFVDGYFSGTSPIDETTLHQVKEAVAQEDGLATFCEKLAEIAEAGMDIDQSHDLSL